ncbi:glycerol-3-phosphate dehydrogenase/oxidase [Tuberibacillus sp. Marseille-P3662]|uniref:glycerol-3-phosphate dehydrogenase/oxidase n=1 Tax=Tuberibacillus sp. Marseille-P3662 TaxID=1965358 RepID=UPI000A1CBCA7|nr:glycerol-3-phosphate dehydrogenase/oxidase [Tuberibacillus sp. Marseille-P3662]
MTFSTLNRSEQLQAMADDTLDLLIIGGGITGTGIALDASVRGLNTGLVEMQDFAAGTSSRSTKLVHGGLRYLAQYEVKLVAEVGRERAIVYENAPHVTTPLWMLLPIYRDGSFSKFMTSIGIWMYDFLAKVKKSERRQMLDRETTLNKAPMLRKDGLKGGGYYVEYRTDDARLTLETMKAAAHRGVKASNYAKVEELLYDDAKQLQGVRVVDQLTGENYNIYAKKIVNAAGPWVDTLREQDGSKQGKFLQLTKGIHIVIDEAAFPLKQAVYFDTTNGDGRMIFAIPREGKVYVGTTDTTYKKEDFSNPKMTEADRDYLLEAINGRFSDVHIRPEDVESSWAGVRPLIYEEGKSADEISRKDEIFVSDSGLITIAGGKLTGYRKMAERVLDLVGEQLKDEGHMLIDQCQTAHIKLSGGDVGGGDGFSDFIHRRVKDGKRMGLEETTARQLVERYGSNVGTIYDTIHNISDEDAEQYGLPKTIMAMVRYGIEEEMTATLLDFFLRRSGALLFHIDWVRQWKAPVTRYMADLLGWSETDVQRFTKELEDMLHQASTPMKDE